MIIGEFETYDIRRIIYQNILEMRAVRLAFQGEFPDDIEYRKIRGFIASYDIELLNLAEVLIKNKENNISR